MVGGRAVSDDERFAVWAFDRDEYHDCVANDLDAQNAVQTAAKLVGLVDAGIMPAVRRIIITDDGDCTVFEWRAGQGVTYPTPAQRGLH